MFFPFIWQCCYLFTCTDVQDVVFGNHIYILLTVVAGLGLFFCGYLGGCFVWGFVVVCVCVRGGGLFVVFLFYY